jgi:hypothetical protein
MDANPAETNPATPKTETPARTGACPFCTRKHLLRARGYARELAEDPTREWERDNLLENLLLAEDHLAALGDALAGELRGIRHSVEEGHDMTLEIAEIYDRFKRTFFPTAINKEF